MAHDVRPSTWSRPGKAGDDLRARINWGLADAVATPEYSELEADLADPETGELPATFRFLVWVPSHSKPGTAYQVRLTFHRPGPGAPHGYVTAAHVKHGCEAHDAFQRCWHLDCALAATLRDYGDTVPGDGKIGERELVRAVPTGPASPAPERRPTGTDPWGLD